MELVPCRSPPWLSLPKNHYLTTLTCQHQCHHWFSTLWIQQMGGRISIPQSHQYQSNPPSNHSMWILFHFQRIPSRREDHQNHHHHWTCYGSQKGKFQANSSPRVCWFHLSLLQRGHQPHSTVKTLWPQDQLWQLFCSQNWEGSPALPWWTQSHRGLSSKKPWLQEDLPFKLSLGIPILLR